MISLLYSALGFGPDLVAKKFLVDPAEQLISRYLGDGKFDCEVKGIHYSASQKEDLFARKVEVKIDEEEQKQDLKSQVVLEATRRSFRPSPVQVRLYALRKSIHGFEEYFEPARFRKRHKRGYVELNLKTTDEFLRASRLDQGNDLAVRRMIEHLPQAVDELVRKIDESYLGN